MKNGEKYPDYNNSILAYCILKLDIVGYPKMVGLFHGKSIYKCMIWGYPHDLLVGGYLPI